MGTKICHPPTGPQSVARVIQEPGVPGSRPCLATYYRSPSADLRRAVISYCMCTKYWSTA